ncbi:myb-like protein X [Mizuhopecten yessoensis]|uniref:Uncharacterized protein n=1 Tax=Mizuhopecten yessoensis TaxID=6573 RepID=A0A210QYS5_MIZYE|nr:myb-like protein X [Mizuhopecten yessoensis]OWF53900.1 hypothetical protein KP79_PYT13088 [Mizuhopecten yessoensis]
MFQDDGQDEYMVQQKVSYRMYEQEQKVLLRSRYPFLSPVQISRKVKDSWNRLKQEAKQFYTKSVLVKTPTKDLTKVTAKSKQKRQKVRGRLDVNQREICDQIGCENDSMELPYQMSLLTSPVDGRLQNDDSAYRSDFYSSPGVSPNISAGIRHDTSCPKLFESPNSESSPHQKFDMFTQKNYTKSKLPLKAPNIIQDEHSTQGILKRSRTDVTPKTKVKGRVSFSTDKNEKFQQIQDYNDIDNSQDDDSEDEYNAMLIRRADDSYNFDDIDDHNMIVEEDRQGELISSYRNKHFNEETRTRDRDVLKFDTSLDKRKKIVGTKKIKEQPDKTQLRKESLMETVEGKNILKPTNSGNIIREKKKRGVAGNCSEKARKQLPVNYGDVRGKKEKLPDGAKGRRRNFSDEKTETDNQSHYSLHENSPSIDKGHKNSLLNDSGDGNSQSNDSANGNSQSNDSANSYNQSNDCSNDSSQSNYIASDNSQSSVHDMRSPILESRKTRSSMRTKQNKKETEVQSLSFTKKESRTGLKPHSVTMVTEDYDSTPVQREETKYITPQMNESVHTHNLREASKIPRKARRSSCREEDLGTKPSDNNLDRSSKLKKQKRRSSRRLAGEEEAYTEEKELQDVSDRFMTSGKKEENVLPPFVDASGDAKVPESPSDQRRSLKNKTKQAIQPCKGKYYNSAKYCDNDEDITKLSDHSGSDSWTIMDEEYNSEVLLSEDENDTHATGQSDASKALVQALHRMKQVLADEDTSDERSSPKLLSPALSGISQMSSVSSDSSAANSQPTSGQGPSTQGSVSADKTVTQGLCDMFGDMTPPQKRTSRHTRRLLASSNRETGSNFAQLFKTQNIFY